MSKLIPKHQTPSQPLVLQNDNTQVVQPILPIPSTNIDWITVANNKIDKSIQEQPHSEVVTNPKRRYGLLTKIKQRLYNNIIPSGYHDPIGRTWNAIIHNQPEVAYDFGEQITRNTKQGDKSKLIKLQTYSAAGNNFADAINTNDLRNALWAKYLGLSDEQVGFKITDYIEESPYKPPHAKPGEIYYRFNPELVQVLNAAQSVEIIPKTIRKPNPYKQKYNPFSSDSIDVKYRPQQYTTIKELPEDFKALADGFGMGTYTVGKGKDENGEYTSYYDEWDINPFSGKSAKIKIPGIEHFGDITIIGTPIKLYDRTYNIPDSTDIKEKHRKLLIQKNN